MRSKLLHFVCELNPRMGGVPTGMELLTTNLVNYEIDSSIASLGNSKLSFQAAAPRIERMKIAGIKIFWTSALFRNPYGLGWNFNLGKKLSQDASYSLVVLHQVYTLSTFVGYRFARKYNIPFVVFPHGSLTKYNESDSKFIKSVAKMLIISRILRRAKSIIVTCKSEEVDLGTVLRSKSVLIPYGTEANINLNQDFNEYFEVDIRILFSGRFTKKKNIMLLLSGMREVLLTYPKAILDIAGTGNVTEINKLRRIVQDLGIENNVKFHGWIEKSLHTELLKSASLLVLPSQNENFGLVVSEALSYGVPCVVSKFVGTSDLVRQYKAGEVLEELTPECVAAAILKVLSGERNNYRDAALKAAHEKLQWSGIALKWRNLIASPALEL
jgi:glycosyltransferase involved in cell wall biosynthesis